MKINEELDKILKEECNYILPIERLRIIGRIIKLLCTTLDVSTLRKELLDGTENKESSNI